MTKEQRTHLIADEKLGGLSREYVETDRKADVGDYVVNPKVLSAGIRKVLAVFGDYVEIKPYLDEDEEDVLGWADGYYKTLAPTYFIQYEGARYKLVDREAEVGEKVIVVDTKDFRYVNGDIHKTERISEGGIFVRHSGECAGMYHSEYLVLVPVVETPEPTEVTEAEASPSVIEMLANLSRRIVALETKNKRMLDEIDTLHRNNVKLAEELANHKSEAKAAEKTTEIDAVDFSAFTEAVVERVAAKLLGENTGGASR